MVHQYGFSWVRLQGCICKVWSECAWRYGVLVYGVWVLWNIKETLNPSFGYVCHGTTSRCLLLLYPNAETLVAETACVVTFMLNLIFS